MQMVTPHIPESAKERCPTDNATQFYYTDAGLSYRCRHCKTVHVVSWEEIIKRYEEARKNVSSLHSNSG